MEAREDPTDIPAGDAKSPRPEVAVMPARRVVTGFTCATSLWWGAESGDGSGVDEKTDLRRFLGGLVEEDIIYDA